MMDPAARKTVALVRTFAASRRANVAIIAAASLPIVVATLALGVDWGYLGYQERAAQADADLAAISAASDLSGAASVLRDYVERNGLDLAVMEETVYDQQRDAPIVDTKGFMTYRLGHYAPAAEVSPEDRFVPAETPYNAVRVRVHQASDLAFAASFMPPPAIETQAIAGTEGVAAFSIGSRLASLNGGVLNAILGGLLGTQIKLDVMDYRALLDADVDLLPLLDMASTELDVQAGNYDELLATSLPVARLFELLANAPGLSGTVRSLVDRIALAANGQNRSIAFGSLFDLDGLAATPGGIGGLDAKVGVLDLISAAAAIANGDHQIDLALGASLPGLASLSVSLLVGERPVHSAWFAVGRTGTLVRTAQTRLKVDANIGGGGLLSGIKIHLPIYLELAYAEGQLAAIDCGGSSSDDAEVDVAVRPGVAEAWIGHAPDDIGSIGTRPAFAPADLVAAPLLKVRGFAHAEIGNPRPRTLQFTPRDIREGRTLSTSTDSYAAPLLSSLIGDLRLDVDLLGLPLASPALVQHSVALLLSSAAKPLDAALYNILLALGIRIGEADVRVTGVRCGRPVLVQ